MSATSTATASEQAPGLPKEYGFSVLVTGLVRMWRGIWPALGIIVLNAVVQAVLVIGDPVFGEWGIGIYLLGAVSAAMLVLTGAVLSAVALESVTGRVGLPAVRSRFRQNLGNYVLWSVGLWLVVWLGFMMFTIPGILVLALTPFVGLAAMDGSRNALGANLRAISARPIRWAVTVLILALLFAIGWFLTAVLTFFIGGVLGSFLAVFGIGLVAWWLLTAFACLYRSTPVGAGDPDTA